MNEQRTAIITDTATNTPKDFIAENDIRVVPLRITFGDETFESGVDITPEELIKRQAVETPKTSLPSPQMIQEAFAKAREDGYENAVFVALSSGLSATYQTVKMVASQMKDFPIAAVDSHSIGIAAGLVVITATELVKAGTVPFRKLQSTLDAIAKRTWVFFSVKSLEHLRKGGRISEPIYRLGSMLNIKPVIWCNESGHYAVASKARGWERSLNAQIRLAQEKAQAFKRVRLAICCSDSCKMFAEMEEKLRRAMAEVGTEIVDIYTSDVSPDLLVHCGPDVVGVGVQGVV